MNYKKVNCLKNGVEYRFKAIESGRNDYPVYGICYENGKWRPIWHTITGHLYKNGVDSEYDLEG